MKKVLVIYDKENWAFHSQAKGLKKHNKLPIDYDIRSYLQLKDINPDSYDMIFSMGLLLSLHPYVFKVLYGRKYVTLVHHYPDEAGLNHKVKFEHIQSELRIARNAVRHASISKRIHDLWKQRFNLDSYYLPSGIDTKTFRPMNRPINSKTTTIGFCGNTNKKLKGFQDYILPAVNRVRRAGFDVRLKVQDYKNLIPHEDMPAFYRDIDLYVCCSSAEGLPTPLVEACSCGVPFVSTDVGVVKEIDNGKNIIVRRDILDLTNGIILMINNINKRKFAGRENRMVMQAGWDWEKICDIWSYFIIGDNKKYHEAHRKRDERLGKL